MEMNIEKFYSILCVRVQFNNDCDMVSSVVTVKHRMQHNKEIKIMKITFIESSLIVNRNICVFDVIKRFVFFI